MKQLLLIITLLITHTFIYNTDVLAQSSTRFTDQQEVTLTAFPNPTLDYLYINLDQATNEEVEVTVYDLLGCKRAAKHYEYADKDFQCKLDLSQMPSGTYLLQVVQGKASYWKQIIKK